MCSGKGAGEQERTHVLIGVALYMSRLLHID